MKIISEKKYIDILNKEIFEFTLESKYSKIQIINLGAIVKNWYVKKNNSWIDVVLGYDNINDYIENPNYFGAVIAPNANRIKDGYFELNKLKYQLEKNNDGNSLHSGTYGLHNKIWNVEEIFSSDDIARVVLSINSNPDKDKFPGPIQITVKYELNNDGTLTITYSGLSNSTDAIFNPTNHSYFNLNGHDSGNVLNRHELMINASNFTPMKHNIPTGEIIKTPDNFNFKNLRLLNEEFDDNFILDSNELSAYAKGLNTGIELSMITDSPCIQLYTSHALTEVNGKENTKYRKLNGFCLETQYAPDSLNHNNFTKPIIKKGELKKYVTKIKIQ